MKNKITKRDILFFFLGVFSIFILEVTLDWDRYAAAFEEGRNAAQKERSK